LTVHSLEQAAVILQQNPFRLTPLAIRLAYFLAAKNLVSRCCASPDYSHKKSGNFPAWA
jgi:hypothetical protein